MFDLGDSKYILGMKVMRSQRVFEPNASKSRVDVMKSHRPLNLKDLKDSFCPSNISQEAKALHSSAHDTIVVLTDQPAPEAGSAKTWDLGTIGEVVGRVGRVLYSVSTSVDHQSPSLNRLLSGMHH